MGIAIGFQVLSLSLLFLSIATVGSLSTYSVIGSLSSKNNSVVAGVNSSFSFITHPSLSVTTDKLNYSPNEIVRIFGKVSDDQVNPLLKKVTIQVFATSIANPIYSNSVVSKNGSFSDTGLSLPQTGTYTIHAFVDNSNEISTTMFSVLDPITSLSAMWLYLAIINLGVLLFLLGIQKTGFSLTELLSFVFISAIVVCAVMGLVATEIDLGVNAPLGLVLKQPVDEKGNIKLDSMGLPQGGQWMINVGGNQHDNYAEGIQFPSMYSHLECWVDI